MLFAWPLEAFEKCRFRGALSLVFQWAVRRLFDLLILPAAKDGRYLGKGEVLVWGKEGFDAWLDAQAEVLEEQACLGYT